MRQLIDLGRLAFWALLAIPLGLACASDWERDMGDLDTIEGERRARARAERRWRWWR